MNPPIQVKIVKLIPTGLIVSILPQGNQTKMAANELVRKVEEGVYVLVEE
jgi:hypothetical protein